MKHQFRDETIHIATGGRDFDASGNVVVLLHGSGQNHLDLDFARPISGPSWIFRSRTRLSPTWTIFGQTLESL